MSLTFSIVIPTYNGADFVAQAIESALSQTRHADEIIISDDNSTDITFDICRKYADKLKLYKNLSGPSGFVNGWNNAIAHAKSEFISILHQDDLLAPTFLEEVETALRLYPNIKHLFVGCSYIDKDNNVIKTSPLYDGSVKIFSGKEYIKAYQNDGFNHIHRCPGVVTHKSIFDKCKYREEAGHIADDDFFFRVGQYTDILGILKPLSSYREHIKSETGHLDPITLLKRLISDYQFQIEHFSENRLFCNSNLQLFKSNKSKMIRRLIGFIMKSGRFEEIPFLIKNL